MQLYQKHRSWLNADSWLHSKLKEPELLERDREGTGKLSDQFPRCEKR